MAALTAQIPRITGTALTFASASGGGDTCPISNTGCLHVKNGSGSPIDVTIAVPGTDDFGQARPDPVIAVAAGAHTVIGPLSSPLLANGSGVVDISYSSATSVTVAYVTTG